MRHTVRLKSSWGHGRSNHAKQLVFRGLNILSLIIGNQLTRMSTDQ